MSITVLVAIAERLLEERIVSAFSSPASSLAVVRRCVDVPDLLAAARTGSARVALVSGSLRRFDREAVAELHAHQIAVVGIAVDEAGERFLEGIGVNTVLGADAQAPALAAAITDAARALVAGPEVRIPPVATAGTSGAMPASAGKEGEVIAVWGPSGAPGRSLVASSLAAEFALLGMRTLLIDADVYASSIAQTLGLLDEVPGIAAATRAANVGTLDVHSLAGYARMVALEKHSGAAPFRVITGLARADRWPELRPSAVVRVLEVARSLATVTVVDCASCLERDEEVSYDVAVPRRNGATLAVLENADRILAVGAADPVGIARLVRGLTELRDAVPETRPDVVMNRLRSGPVTGDPHREVREALQRFAGVVPFAWLPEDRAAADAALATGRLIVEDSPGSAFRLALRALAADIAGVTNVVSARTFAAKARSGARRRRTRQVPGGVTR